MNLYLNIKFYLNENRFEVDSNVKEENQKEIIFDFLQNQREPDLRKANEKDIYEIKLNIDLTNDSISCFDDCGNDNFRDGILLFYLKGKYD